MKDKFKLKNMKFWKKMLSIVLIVAFLVQTLPSDLFSLIASAQTDTPSEIYLSDLGWEAESTPAGWYGTIQKDKKVDGGAVEITGKSFNKAIGTHTHDGVENNQDTIFDIKGMGYKYFETYVGIGNVTQGNKVKFSILVDGVEQISHTVTAGQAAKKLAVSVDGAEILTLRVNCTEDGFADDSSIWADPILKKSYPMELYVSDIPWQSTTEPLFWGNLNRDLGPDGGKASIGTKGYEHAIGTHTFLQQTENQDVVIDVSGLGYTSFTTEVGSPNAGQPNMVEFSVLVDGEVKATCTTTGMQEANTLTVDVENAKTITLRVNCSTDGNGYDTAIWGNPKLIRKPSDELYLSDLGWTDESTPAGWYVTIQKDKTVDGKTPEITGRIFNKAIGTHTHDGVANNQDTIFDIEDLGYKYFETYVGIGNVTQGNKVKFTILVDGVERISHTVTAGQAAKKLAVSVDGAKTLTLRVNCTEDGWADDSSVWADPVLKKSFPDELYVSDIPWQSATEPLFWGDLNRDLGPDGAKAVIGSKTYEHAIGTHTFLQPTENQDVVIDIAGLGYKFFTAEVGSPNVGQPNMVQFSVLVDGELKETCTTSGMQEASILSVNVEGANTITLRVNCGLDGNGFDTSIWGNPKLQKTQTVDPNREYIYLSEIAWTSETTQPGFGTLGKDRTVDGLIPTIAGVEYTKALGTHAINDMNLYQDIVYDIEDLGFTWFDTLVGIQDRSLEPDYINSVRFSVLVDGVEVTKRLATAFEEAQPIYVNIEGAKKLTLRVNCTADMHAYDNAIWAMPRLSRNAPQVEPKDMPDTLDLTELDWVYAEAGWGTAQKNKNCEGGTLKILDKVYEKGLGTHAFSTDYPADFIYDIAGMGYKYLSVDVGVDAAGAGTVQFEVVGDGKVLETSPILGGSDEPYHMNVDITDVKELILRAYNADGTYSNDRADWGAPMLYKDASLMPVSLTINQLYEGKAIFDDELSISGTSSGIDTLRVYVDNKLLATINDVEFEWNTVVSLNKTGKHTIKVEGLKAGNIVCEQSISIEKVEFDANETITFKTKSTEMKVGRMGNMLAVTSLKNVEDDYDWLANVSEVHFPETIMIDGKDKEVSWTYQKKTDKTVDGVRTVTFSFECNKYDLTLDSIWTAYPKTEAPIRHSMNMWNKSGKNITVYSVSSLQLDLQSKPNETPELMAITKGAKSPDGVGTYFYTIESGMSKNVFTATDYRFPDSELGYVPFAGIQSDAHGLYMGLEWPQGRILTEGGALTAEGQEFSITNGLNADFHTIIPSGLNYEIPAAFIGTYNGDRDDGSNEMTEWFADYMMQEDIREDSKYPMLQYSFWYSTARTRLEWVSTDKNYFKAVDDLAELGFTSAVLDVGWSTTPGTFTADPIRWADGLKKHADYAHNLGLDFGVYFRPINGLSTVPGSLTSVEGVGNAEWFVAEGGGQPIDLGNEEAKEVLLAGFRKLISESDMDILRVDFGGIAGESIQTNLHSNETDVTYWTARGWYEIMDILLAEFPDLKWESVNCGGCYKDFKSMQYASHIQTTDNFVILPQRQSFYDASYVLPTQQIMQWYSDVIWAQRTTEDYDYLFRSNILGWSGFLIEMPDDMVPEEYEAFARATEIYKEWMQPLVKYANLYHVLPRPNGVDWDGVQYYDPDTGKGALLVFKCTTDKNTRTVKLDGLNEEKTYHIWTEDRTIPYAEVSGAELMKEGVTFTLKGQYKSEILYIQEVGKNDDYVKAPGKFSIKSNTTLTVDASETVTVEWNKAKSAEYYTVTLYNDKAIVAQMDTEETRASFKGLEPGINYTWDVVAKNVFGETDVTGKSKIKVQGDAIIEKLANLTIEGTAERKNCEDDNLVYIDSLIFQTDDAVLSANGDQVIIAQLDPTAGYKTLTGTLAIANHEEGMQAEMLVSTDKGVSKKVLLNENDINRNISLDVEGASQITITVKNSSKDILKQTTRLLHVYADGNNPFKDYYRVLHDTAMKEYVFSADVKHDIIGVIDSTPRYGIFAGYTDANNFVGAYLDYQYNLFTTVARVNGVKAGTVHIPLPSDFNHEEYHTITAYREGDTFKIYLDGQLMDIRTASIGASKPGLSDNDTWVTYRNITLENGEFSPEAPVGGKWNGLAPTVVFNSAWLYGEEIIINEKEPAMLTEDEITKIDKSATLDSETDGENSQLIDFDVSTDEDLFKYYSSGTDTWEVENEELVSGVKGEQKATLKAPICIEDGMIQADIGISEVGGRLNGGLYVYANEVRNGQDAITGLNIQLESASGSRNLNVSIYQFDQGYRGSLASTTLSNFFADGDTKAPVNVKVIFTDGLLSVYVDNELQIPLMNIPLEGWEAGAVGLRSQEAGTTFDNIRISATKLGTPQEPDIPNISDEESEQESYTFNSIWDALDFDFYHSSNGGFTIRDGKLTPSGEEGEFKAVLRGDNRAYKSVSVDIYPGADGTINSGLYIGATGAGHAVDKINALGILVQSDFEGWDDAANRIDIIIGEFPEWKELSRTISETGKKNELFSNGEKEPVNLRVDIDGNKLTITLSLISDPSVYVQTIYEYTGELDLEHGAVGVRSMFDDCSFDHFKVSYAESTGNNTTANGNVSNNESGKGTTGSANTGDPWTTTLAVLNVTTIVSLGVILFLLGKKRKEQF